MNRLKIVTNIIIPFYKSAVHALLKDCSLLVKLSKNRINGASSKRIIQVDKRHERDFCKKILKRLGIWVRGRRQRKEEVKEVYYTTKDSGEKYWDARYARTRGSSVPWKAIFWNVITENILYAMENLPVKLIALWVWSEELIRLKKISHLLYR